MPYATYGCDEKQDTSSSVRARHPKKFLIVRCMLALTDSQLARLTIAATGTRLGDGYPPVMSVCVSASICTATTLLTLNSATLGKPDTHTRKKGVAKIGRRKPHLVKAI